MSKVAIIAALERELTPLVKGWTREQHIAAGRQIILFKSDNAIAACGGMGTVAARQTTDYVLRTHAEVEAVISVGLAGALTPELKVSAIIWPRVIIDEADGLKIEMEEGSGILVTASVIAEQDLKQALASRFSADAVDMEAYAVGDVARIHKRRFVAIKAISDELTFPMPPLGKFVTTDGQFETGKFAFYAAMRPWMWPTVIQLGRNSARATAALSLELQQALQRFLHEKSSQVPVK